MGFFNAFCLLITITIIPLFLNQDHAADNSTSELTNCIDPTNCTVNGTIQSPCDAVTSPSIQACYAVKDANYTCCYYKSIAGPTTEKCKFTSYPPSTILQEDYFRVNCKSQRFWTNFIYFIIILVLALF